MVALELSVLAHHGGTTIDAHVTFKQEAGSMLPWSEIAPSYLFEKKHQASPHHQG
jgi:hypothetical protein